jgi:hypothetical protein
LIDKDVVLTTKDTIQYLKIPKPTYPRDIRLRRINGIKAGRMGGDTNPNDIGIKG